ncbi:hypothetical protein [Legionella feeleii]|uniref:Ninein n=1 Tax=Legionella feeleii TaxID=453 RepID=A0A0W0TY38_9GAMM|nr:hypothetical protein [Legionella feeleii]KTD00622.1 ninein [Legionella feeleii]SPX59276.1 ninein [Legionella feeleii]
MKYEDLRNYLLEKLQLDTAKSDVLEYMTLEYAGVLKYFSNTTICCQIDGNSTGQTPQYFEGSNFHFGYRINDLFEINNQNQLHLISKSMIENIPEIVIEHILPIYSPPFVSNEDALYAFKNKKISQVSFVIPHDICMKIINASSLIKASGNIENLSQEELKNLKKGVLAYKVNNKDEFLLNLINKLEDKINRLLPLLNINNEVVEEPEHSLNDKIDEKTVIISNSSVDVEEAPAVPKEFAEAGELFEAAVETMKKKVLDLRNKAHKDKRYELAAEKAEELLSAVSEAGDDFFINEGSAEQFKQRCDEAIKKARPELAKHRGWSKLFADITFIAVSVCTVGVANIVSKLATGSFRFFTPPKTESEEQLDLLEKNIHSIGKK